MLSNKDNSRSSLYSHHNTAIKSILSLRLKLKWGPIRDQSPLLPLAAFVLVLAFVTQIIPALNWTAPWPTQWSHQVWASIAVFPNGVGTEHRVPMHFLCNLRARDLLFVRSENSFSCRIILGYFYQCIRL